MKALVADCLKVVLCVAWGLLGGMILTSCDMGTDIGNGRKPIDEEQEESRHERSEAEPTTSGPHSPKPPISQKEHSETDGREEESAPPESLPEAEDQQDQAEEPISNDDSPPSSEESNINDLVTYLSVPCASPLPLMLGQYESDSRWFEVIQEGDAAVLIFGDEELEVLPDDDTDFPFDLDADDSDPSLTCTTISYEEGRIDVELSDGGSIIWETTDGQVETITVTPPDGEAEDFRAKAPEASH